MKKWLALLIALVLALGLTACGDSPSDKKDDAKPSQSTGDDTPAKPDKASYVLKDCTVLDDDNCTFIITGVEEDDFGYLEFGVSLENKTDLTLMFGIDNATVNGYLEDPVWAKEVAPGKKANSSFSFNMDELEEHGLLPIDELSFTLRAYDSEDWAADNLVDERFTVYPTGKTADTVTHPDRVKVDGEQVMADNDNCVFIIQSTDPDGFWGYTLNVYMENRTDSAIMFSWNDVSVNGYMIDPYWATELPANSAAYKQISFYKDDLEESGIETVEEIEFKLRVSNSDDWFADAYLEQVFTYNP